MHCIPECVTLFTICTDCTVCTDGLPFVPFVPFVPTAPRGTDNRYDHVIKSNSTIDIIDTNDKILSQLAL
ncbi:hypothetical protein ACJ72_08777 [Emergomyces africanus]|uniref:Uncharacterized protein n=1 Tax=Emergomyces africanus TaxID=1955775 RepID=A0A1B7NJU5_9EURO|nr:hypothetical protein ACJ72_08777 [Emergomyces africanus]